MARNNIKQNIVFYIFGLLLVIWLALLTAPHMSGGLPEIARNLPAALNNPLSVTWGEDSVNTVLIFISAYVIGTPFTKETERRSAYRVQLLSKSSFNVICLYCKNMYIPPTCALGTFVLFLESLLPDA